MARGRLRSGSCRVETPAPRPRHSWRRGGAPVGWSVGRTESAERNAALNKPDERPGRGGRAGCRECFSALAARRFSFDGSRLRRDGRRSHCAHLCLARRMRGMGGELDETQEANDASIRRAQGLRARMRARSLLRTHALRREVPSPYRTPHERWRHAYTTQEKKRDTIVSQPHEQLIVVADAALALAMRTAPPLSFRRVHGNSQNQPQCGDLRKPSCRGPSLSGLGLQRCLSGPTALGVHLTRLPWRFL